MCNIKDNKETCTYAFRQVSHHLQHTTLESVWVQEDTALIKMVSCETALIKKVSLWASYMNDGRLIGLVLPDLGKAFEMVNHDILID